MTPCDDIQGDLSQLVDAGLDPVREAAVRAHLATCAQCRGLFEDLGRLSAAGRMLGPIAPPDHVWLEIAGQVRLPDREITPAQQRTPRRPSSAVWQWAGLSAAILAVTTALYVLDRPDASRPAPASSAVSGVAAPSTETDELTQAVRPYEQAIAQLEVAAGRARVDIDPALAAALAAEGDVIDRAIAESRQAAVASPDSEPARLSLFEALRRKINVLQSTVELINEMSQGDAAGAARVAEGLGRES